MNYENMSDFEINKRVAEALLMITEDGYHNSDAVCAGFTGAGDMREFDPCNKPSDAWPIIVENRITITPYDDFSQGWFATTDTSFFVDDKNPLRAAMIVYLMMQESK